MCIIVSFHLYKIFQMQAHEANKILIVASKQKILTLKILGYTVGPLILSI